MKTFRNLLLGAFVAVPLTFAQAPPANPTYMPPTHGEKFRTYLGHTYEIGSILEAGARAGIDPALDKPRKWLEGTKGYFERFGSAMGLHAARGTATYGFSELFHEDLRSVHCAECPSRARSKPPSRIRSPRGKGPNGHEAFSGARLLGPIPGAWRPARGGPADSSAAIL